MYLITARLFPFFELYPEGQSTAEKRNKVQKCRKTCFERVLTTIASCAYTKSMNEVWLGINPGIPWWKWSKASSPWTRYCGENFDPRWKRRRRSTNCGISPSRLSSGGLGWSTSSTLSTLLWPCRPWWTHLMWAITSAFLAVWLFQFKDLNTWLNFAGFHDESRRPLLSGEECSSQVSCGQYLTDEESTWRCVFFPFSFSKIIFVQY